MKSHLRFLIALAVLAAVVYSVTSIHIQQSLSKSDWVTSSSPDFKYLEFYSTSTQNHAGHPVLSYKKLDGSFSDIRYLNSFGMESSCYLVATRNDSGEKTFLLSNFEKGVPKCNGTLGAIYKSDWLREKAWFEG